MMRPGGRERLGLRVSRSGNLAGVLLAGLLLLTIAVAAKAQGCAMCRDTTAGSPPAVRKTLRRAIPLLGIPAGAIFVGILIFAARIKPLADEELQDESYSDSGQEP